jgi:hypothetical protein
VAQVVPADIQLFEEGGAETEASNQTATASRREATARQTGEEGNTRQCQFNFSFINYFILQYVCVVSKEFGI